MYQLKPKTIPLGDTLELEYTFINEDGTIPDFNDFECFYVVSQYGFEDINLISKSMSLSSGTTNTFTVTLESTDTISLGEGTFTVKVILVNENTYLKKARGVLNILKDSETAETTNI